MHPILKKLNIEPSSNLAFQLAQKSDEELAAIVCALGHDRFANMKVGEMKKDNTYLHYRAKSRTDLLEDSNHMIRCLK